MAENKKTTKKSTTKPATKKTTSKTTTKTSKAATKTTNKTTTKKPVKTEKIVKEVVETKPIEMEKTESANFIKDNYRNILLVFVCILLIVNIILIVSGHKVKLSNGSEVIASVKGKEYTAEQLFDTLKSKNGKDALLLLIDEYIADKELSKEDIKEVKSEAKQYIESIKSQYESSGYVWEEVLTQYGYENEDALVDEYLVTLKQQKVVLNYIGKQIKEEEIKKYYDENVYGTYTVKHILVKPAVTDGMTEEDTKNAEEAAKNKAQEAINRYANGENWADLVTEYSEDEGSKESEGLVENFTKGDVDDEFFKASVALKKDEYTSEPVKSSFGYHVILKVSETEKKSLKDSKKDIISALTNEKLNNDSKLYNSSWAKIRKEYKLEITDTDIKSAYEKSINE